VEKQAILSHPIDVVITLFIVAEALACEFILWGSLSAIAATRSM
jgi:hypothetical protein